MLEVLVGKRVKGVKDVSKGSIEWLEVKNFVVDLFVFGFIVLY